LLHLHPSCSPPLFLSFIFEKSCLHDSFSKLHSKIIDFPSKNTLSKSRKFLTSERRTLSKKLTGLLGRPFNAPWKIN
jgi:hypothetical protein